MHGNENPKRGGADVGRWRKIDMTNWIWDADLHIVKKVILQGYVRHADKEGVAWPSVATLCKYTSMSDRSIHMHRKELVAMGLLEVVENRPGRSIKMRVNTEVLKHPRLALVVGDTPEESSPPKDVRLRSSCAQPPKNLRPTPEGHSEEYIQGTSFKEPIQINVEAQLWEEINQMLKTHGRRHLKLTNARRRALKGRIKEHSKADVLSVVKWWLTSTHQRAIYIRQNHSIDTVLRPANFTPYLEFSSEPQLSPEDKFLAEMEAYEQAAEAELRGSP